MTQRTRPPVQARELWRWLLAGLRSFLPAAPLAPFDPDAERVLQRARLDASSGGFEYIGGEHLLGAILAEPESLAGLVLARLEAEQQAQLDRLPADARAELPRSVGSPRLSIAADLAQLRPGHRPSSPKPDPGDLSYTRRLQTALRLAGEHAQATGHADVNSVHLLLGLIAEQGGIAAYILENAGVEASYVQAALLSLSGGSNQAAPSDRL